MKKILVKSSIYIVSVALLLGCVSAVHGEISSKAKKTQKLDSVVLKRPSKKKSSVGASNKKPLNRRREKGMERLKEILGNYRKSSGILMELKKEVYISLMEETKSYDGQLLLSKGRLKLEIVKPEKSLLIVDGNTIWLESQFDKNIQVSKLSTTGKDRKKGLIGLFFGETSIWDGYRLIKAQTKKNLTQYTMVPKTNNKKPEAEKIIVEIDKNKKFVTNLSYWDELENRTMYQFSKIDFKVEVKKDTFKYIPPKDAQITNY